MSAAMIRFITPDNAASLGYEDADYDDDGLWVLEEGGEWSADLRDIDETDTQAAKAAAEDLLGNPSGTWKPIVANYGIAYELLVH
jgi:hypothetical protein